MIGNTADRPPREDHPCGCERLPNGHTITNPAVHAAFHALAEAQGMPPGEVTTNTTSKARGHYRPPVNRPPGREAAFKALEQAQAARDAGMTDALAAADVAWVEEARRAVWWCATQMDTFTTDDVWDRLDSREVPPPREPRAMGPIITRATKAKAITDTGERVPSRRRHAAPIPVYRRTP